jgi:hypothetical protein
VIQRDEEGDLLLRLFNGRFGAFARGENRRADEKRMGDKTDEGTLTELKAPRVGLEQEAKH